MQVSKTTLLLAYCPMSNILSFTLVNWYKEFWMIARRCRLHSQIASRSPNLLSRNRQCLNHFYFILISLQLLYFLNKNNVNKLFTRFRFHTESVLLQFCMSFQDQLPLCRRVPHHKLSYHLSQTSCLCTSSCNYNTKWIASFDFTMIFLHLQSGAGSSHLAETQSKLKHKPMWIITHLHSPL